MLQLFNCLLSFHLRFPSVCVRVCVPLKFCDKEIGCFAYRENFTLILIVLLTLFVCLFMN